ncbi:MAG: SH3 domain-containing protein [Acetatifactor sp.]|nr:SH3 domain-containing protein [Acetatifactor sp.]
MQRNKWSVIRDYIVKHCKIIFPLIVLVVVAITVTVALRMSRERAEDENNGPEANPSAEGDGLMVDLENIPEIPLQTINDGEVYSLVVTYYNSLATGDVDTLRTIYDTISENDLQFYKALSEYMDYYTEIQLNTKQGLEEGSVVAYIYYRVRFMNHEDEFPGSNMLYICKREDGEFYIKNESSLTEAEEIYITTVSDQADVKDFYNRVSVEYEKLIRENPALAAYITEVSNQVNIDRGVALAEQNQSAEQPKDGGEGQEGDGTTTVTPEPEVPATPEYATATTTVNVRSSDSEKADKLGSVPNGTRVKVQEVGVNGWTKVVFEGADGYIKSEYLKFAESTAGQTVIGSVTAKTNVNARASASTTAEKLGMLTGGESLDLLAVEGDWCKVVFNGQVAYVKAEFVSIN